MKKIQIRTVTESDAEALLDIYAPFVEKTAVSFEYTVPSVDEFKKRIQHITEKYPYIAAEIDGRIVGYAYAGIFRIREAYKHSVETSIYVDEKYHGLGIGKILYRVLEELLHRQNIFNMYAGVTYTDAEDDPYLTKRSLFFHQKLGFQKAAHYKKCGYKFDRWYDFIFLEKHIQMHVPSPEPVIPFSELKGVEQIISSLINS